MLQNFFFVTYEWTKEASVFVPDNTFLPRLMFSSKAGAYPKGARHWEDLRLENCCGTIFSAITVCQPPMH